VKVSSGDSQRKECCLGGRKTRRPTLLLLLAGLFLVACGSAANSPSTVSSTPVTARSSHAASTLPAMKTGVDFTASDSGGDKVTGTISFGAVKTVANSSLNKSIFESCTGHGLMMPTRTVTLPMQVTVVGNSSMSDEASILFNGPSLGFIIGFPNGLQCAGPEGPSYKTTLASGQSDTTTIWLIYPGALTPNEPSFSSKKLGQQFFDLTIYLSGGQATIDLTGPRVSNCIYHHDDIVPAGSMNCSTWQ